MSNIKIVVYYILSVYTSQMNAFNTKKSWKMTTTLLKIMST